MTAEVSPLLLTHGLVRVQSEPTVLGDVNLDYELNLTDATSLLDHLLLGATAMCPAAADFHQDTLGNISDPIALLSALFRGGPTPLATDVLCESP